MAKKKGGKTDDCWKLKRTRYWPANSGAISGQWEVLPRRHIDGELVGVTGFGPTIETAMKSAAEAGAIAAHQKQNP